MAVKTFIWESFPSASSDHVSKRGVVQVYLAGAFSGYYAFELVKKAGVYVGHPQCDPQIE
jgi:hypothetical protein